MNILDTLIQELKSDCLTLIMAAILVLAMSELERRIKGG